MGFLQMILDSLASLLGAVGGFIGGVNPCPFKDGITFGSEFDTAFAILNAFVDVPFCVGAVFAWATALAGAWLVMTLWRWLNVQ